MDVFGFSAVPWSLGGFVKTKTREKALIVIGVAWIVAGTAAVLPTTNFLLQQLGDISSRHRVAVIIVIGGVAFMLACWGAVTIGYRTNNAVMNLNVLLIFSVLMSPLLMEVILRTGIAFGSSVFRIPGLYSNPFSDEDYYKLRVLWGLDSKERTVSELEYDPILGWAYKRTPENPLGVLGDDPSALETMEKSVLFYGDSFLVAGSLMADRIPQQLDRLLPDKTVYNFGVPGYGLDQIYLRFRQSHHHFKNPIVIVGILTVDMDRCILKFRSGRPKPYFLIKRNELVLGGVPVETDTESYLRSNSVSIDSYFGAALIQFVRYLIAGGNAVASQHLRGDIEQITKLIIEGIVQEAHDNSLDLRFVVFVPKSGGDWRKAFLLREIEHWKIPYVDTETVLVEAMPKSGNFSMLYYDQTHHHNELANGIIAKAIADQFFRGSTSTASLQ